MLISGIFSCYFFPVSFIVSSITFSMNAFIEKLFGNSFYSFSHRTKMNNAVNEFLLLQKFFIPALHINPIIHKQDACVTFPLIQKTPKLCISGLFYFS